MEKKNFFEVEVGRNNNVWVDNVPMCLKDFGIQLPDYVSIKKSFRISRACWLVQTLMVNKVTNMIKDAGGKLV